MAGLGSKVAGRATAPMYGPLLLIALLAPLLVVLAAGLGVPLYKAVTSAFAAKDEGKLPIVSVIGDDVFWSVLRRTISTAGIVSLICVVLAYPTALLIHGSSPRWQPLLLAMVIVPLWASVIARTYGWIGLLQTNGVLDQLAGVVNRPPLQLLYTRGAVIVGMVHVLLPLVLLPVYAAVARFDRRLEWASHSLGAGSLRTQWAIKLPVLAPQIAAAGMAVFVIGAGFLVTPAALGGPKSQMLANLVSQEALQRYDLPRAQAMSLVLLAAILVAIVAVAAMLALSRRFFR